MLSERREESGILYIYDSDLPNGALSNRYVTKIVAPNLIRMGNDCVYNCPKLDLFVAPKLKKIGRDNFEACPLLKEIIAPYLKLQNIHFIGSLLIDLDKKEILNIGLLDQKLVRAIEKELKSADELFLEVNGKNKVLKTLKHDILRVEDGVITYLCLPTTKVVPAHALYGNKGVREFVALKAEKLDHNAIYKAQDLEVVRMPKLKEARFSNFSKCPRLKEVISPILSTLQEGCFCSNPMLKSLPFEAFEYVADGCFCDLKKIKDVKMTKLVALGANSFEKNKLRLVYMPALTYLERGTFLNSTVEYLYAPKLTNRSPSIKYLKNARELMRNKHFLPERFIDGLEKE